MNKEKIGSLTKYVNGLKDKLANPVPHKKRGTLESYKQFLKNEIDAVVVKLDAAKLDGGGK